MASDSTSSAAQPAAGDPAARLKQIGARVADLSRRIQGERDPKAVAELRAEVGKLTELLSELIQSAAGGSGAVTKAAPVLWPRALGGESAAAGDSVYDPAEVSGD